MPTRLSLLLLLVMALVGSGAQGPTDPLKRVRELGNRAPSRLFFSIARNRDAEAFARLRLALAEISDQSTLEAGYGATSLFKGSGIEREVARWLETQIFMSREPAHQVAATRALTDFWLLRGDVLQRIVRNHPSRECREVALVPLMPLLVSRGDRASCKLLFENANLGGNHRGALLGALRSFEETPAESYLAGRLRDLELPAKQKLLLLDVLADRESKAVKSALEKCLQNPVDEVRLRTLEILGARREGPTMARLSRVVQSGNPDFIVEAIGILAKQREGDPHWIEELYGFTNSQSPDVRVGAARALGELPTQDALTLLHRLLSDKVPKVQLAALELISTRRQMSSIPKLITALETSGGIVAREISHHLRLLTGEDHGSSGKRWRAWFEAEGAEFQMPTTEEALALEKARASRREERGEFRTATFYGLKIKSDRVCFVLDTSGSMAESAGGRFSKSKTRQTTRISVAKRELTSALRQLLDGVQFNVIAFASDVTALQPSLITLGSSTRAEALENVQSWTANGGTAIYDALRRALRDKEVEVIYLLTDGEPTMGEVQDIGEIRRRVREYTKRRKVKIHGIAIGQPSTLLQWLAEDSDGQYVEIL